MNSLSHEILDEYGFKVAANTENDYLAFLESEKNRQMRIEAMWKEQQKDEIHDMMDRGSLAKMIREGFPKKQRGELWMIASGAMRRKRNQNANHEETYYQILVQKNEEALKKEKIPIDFTEIEKDISRTFPGHEELDSETGQQKLKRILEAFARRNKNLGYCQSMNFLTAWALLFLEEEDAFYLITVIVEDLLPGLWAKNMITIQQISATLEQLIQQYLPKLYRHIQEIHFPLILLATKWFMCLFVCAFPSETVNRLWDLFFMEGETLLYKVTLILLDMVQEDLLKATETMIFMKTLSTFCLSLYDYDKIEKCLPTYDEISALKIEKIKQQVESSVKKAPEDLKLLKEQVNSDKLSESFYRNLSGRMDSLFRKSKDFVVKKQVQIAKMRTVINKETEKSFLEMSHQKHLAVDSIIQGVGVRFYPNGMKYNGNFHAGKRNGYGMLFNKDGTLIYDGFWKDDKREGTGTVHGKDGSNYKGQWKNDVFNGKGTLKSVKGTYIGDFKNGLRDGKGTMTYSNGNFYQGEWINDKRHGRGTMCFSNGNKYEGFWVSDFQQGKGTMVYTNGDSYSGLWSQNKRHGSGSYTWVNGASYTGEWEMGLRSGRGTMQFIDGSRYDGDWKSNKQEGFGTLTYVNGNTYKGRFKDNQMDGKGEYIFANGRSMSGMFSNGEKFAVEELAPSRASSFVQDSPQTLQQ